jgi:uncharacterized protein YdaU (DUF1376 family)
MARQRRPTDKLLAEWFWIDRWDGSSAVTLPMEARGLYREMLTQAWRRGAQLPKDPEAIQRLIRCTREEWERCWPKVRQYWKVSGESLVNETQLEVYSDAKAARDAAHEKAKNAAASRRRPTITYDSPSPQGGSRGDAQAPSQAPSQDAPQAERETLPEIIPPSPSPSPSLEPERTNPHLTSPARAGEGPPRRRYAVGDLDDKGRTITDVDSDGRILMVEKPAPGRTQADLAAAVDRIVLASVAVHGAFSRKERREILDRLKSGEPEQSISRPWVAAAAELAEEPEDPETCPDCDRPVEECKAAPCKAALSEVAS